MRVGSMTASAKVFPSESSVVQGLPETSTTLRIKEKPLEWGPLEASPRTTSPADQCAAGKFAAVCDAFDNAFGNVNIKMTAGEVVKEE